MNNIVYYDLFKSSVATSKYYTHQHVNATENNLWETNEIQQVRKGTHNVTILAGLPEFGFCKWQGISHPVNLYQSLPGAEK